MCMRLCVSGRVLAPRPSVCACTVALSLTQYVWTRLLAGQKPGYFRDEIRPKLKHTLRGTVAMANLGPDLNDSRFFITLADGLADLDGKHTVFGQVAEGLDVLDKISGAFCDDAGRPYKDIRCVPHIRTLFAYASV
jgi:cyclophilin family peptidyl-prolyl cis-trans isomerase